MKPTKSNRQPGLIVYFCGVATSVLVLWAVNWLNDNQHVNVMGWYINGIIPGGALVVGIASGCGYALASRFLNAKLSKAFVVGMISTALLDYVAAQYLTYSNLLERHHASSDQYSFFRYMQDICENMTFTSSRSGSRSSDAGVALGWFGYVFKVLEMAGFAVGSMLPSAMLFGMPYCKGCQLYLKNAQTAFLNSSEKSAVIHKMKKPQRLEALEAAIQELGARVQPVIDRIATTSLAQTVAVLNECEKANDKKAAGRVIITLKKCPTCDAHHVSVGLTNSTVDKKVANSTLATLDKTTLPEPAEQAAQSALPE